MAVCFIVNYSSQLLFDFNSKSLVQTLWHPNSIASQRVILRGICIAANKLLKLVLYKMSIIFTNTD